MNPHSIPCGNSAPQPPSFIVPTAPYYLTPGSLACVSDPPVCSRCEIYNHQSQATVTGKVSACLGPYLSHTPHQYPLPRRSCCDRSEGELYRESGDVGIFSVGWVTVGRLFSLPGPQFPHLYTPISLTKAYLTCRARWEAVLGIADRPGVGLLHHLTPAGANGLTPSSDRRVLSTFG